MKLTNRGVSSESDPPSFELTEGEIVGKYQGANGINHYPRHIPVTQPIVDLKDHGVADSTSEPIDAEASLVGGTVSTRQQVLDELNTTHLANIRQNLEHRLQVARAKGDQNLIRLLEAEAEQLA